MAEGRENVGNKKHVCLLINQENVSREIVMEVSFESRDGYPYLGAIQSCITYVCLNPKLSLTN